MTLRGRLERAERKLNERPDRWATLGGPEMRLLVTWEAAEAATASFRDVLAAIPEEGEHSDAVAQLVGERWPALAGWFAGVPADGRTSIDDPPVAALAEAVSVPRPIAEELVDASPVDRDAQVVAYWLASFARALTHGVGVRYEHPAYARNG